MYVHNRTHSFNQGHIEPTTTESPNSSEWTYRSGEWRLSYDDGEEITLLHAKHDRLPMKNFSTEVRASADVNQFLGQAVLLLHVDNKSLEDVIDKMLYKMLGGKETSSTIDQAKEVLFADESKTLLSRTIQGACVFDGVEFDYDQSWICAMCNLVSLQKGYVAIARLKHPANMGNTLQEIRFLILVLTPTKQKGTKNELETARTFATIFASRDLRRKLLEAHDETKFKKILHQHAEDLAIEHRNPLNSQVQLLDKHESEEKYKFRVGQGLWSDIKRRKAHYLSDFVDGFIGHKTIHKTLATIFFLYFACILPIMAFGSLYDDLTDGEMDVRKSIIGQTIGGLIFALIGGQPLVIIMTTAPLSLYVKVIHSISEEFQLNFQAMYACVGLWNTLLLILYSAFNASRLMEFSTRSTEEIFSLFIGIAFVVEPVRAVYDNFQQNYLAPACYEDNSGNLSLHQVNNSTFNFLKNSLINESSAADGSMVESCARETSLLYLLLMLGTVWLAVSLYNFNKTPYLQANIRELLADYALPVAVLLVSFVGSYLFQAVPTRRFRFDANFSFSIAPLHLLPWTAVLAALGLGFALSLLFFIDQNISAAMVNNPSNKLKKGSAYHLDLLVVGLINAFLSLYGFPFMHGVLPHSPLHARSLADIEERVDQGHAHDIIVKARETRVTAVVSHILIGLSLLMLPYPLAYIPTPVLYGLFLYMAITSLSGNQMFERITILFMEQASYPPTHYIRRCPQRMVHIFTMCQVLQLILLCFFGFASWPYVQMIFPVIIILVIPFRYKIVPHLVDEKYLEALDP